MSDERWTILKRYMVMEIVGSDTEPRVVVPEQRALDAEAEVEALRAERDRLRRHVRAVVREWADYPESYPRRAFADDVLAALSAVHPETEAPDAA